MKTELVWMRPAVDDLRRLDAQVRTRVHAAMRRYIDQGAGDVRQLAGRPEWRLRVGDWRVLFLPRMEDRPLEPPATGTERVRVIEVLRVLPRGRAYRD